MTLPAKRHHVRYLVGAVVVAAAFVRLAAALRRPLYVDEGLSLTIGVLPIGQELDFLRHDFHPPLFFILLHAFEGAQLPIWSIRVAVAMLGVVSVILLMLIVRQWCTIRAAIAAAAIAALVPSLVFYDTWLRMYSLVNALDLSAILLLTLLVTRATALPLRIVTWVGWIALNVGALYTQYLAWMALAAQVLFAAALRRRILAQTILCAATAAALWLPQLSTFRIQLAAGGDSFGWYQTHLAQGLWELPSQATVDPLVEGWPAHVAAGLVWIWIVIAFVGAWPRMKQTILPWLGAPAVLIVAYSLIAHKDLYDARYFLLLPYALAAWTGVALEGLWQKRTGLPLAIALGASLAAAACTYAFDSAFYTSDWPHVADVVRAHAEPSDLLIFEPGAGDWAFRYYADERSYRIVQVSTPVEIDRALAQIERNRRVWLIGSGIIGIDPQLRLLHELQAHFRLAYFEESKRSLPSQDVQIGLFVRR